MKNEYAPIAVRVERVEEHSTSVKLFRLVRSDGKNFPTRGDGLWFTPGQFVLAGLWGYGEAPFGAASDPADPTHVDVIIRRAGVVTNALHALKKGAHATLRGPYGNGYPLEFFENKDVLLVTGGCGIPPIAALLRHIVARRRSFGRVTLIYGAATPGDILMKKDLARWKRSIDVVLTVDTADCDWDGKKGFVSSCLPEIPVNPAATVVAMCGPGPMVDAIEHLLNERGVSDRRIFVSMERRMQCGVGRCQHCVTGESYVCTDGPVFNLDQIDGNWD